MDHFVGFDRLLRVCLHRTMPLHLVGPAGFADRVEHKLKAYTLDLLGEDSCDFVITVAEFNGERFDRLCEFHARETFRQREVSSVQLPPGTLLDGPRTLLDEDEFRIDSVVLDHGTPCLAFAFEEKLRVNVWSEGLKLLRLPVGPWLSDAKRAVRRGAPDDSKIVIRQDQSIPLGVLKQHALRTARGQKIAYVVDAAYHETNINRIVALARGADQLFMEAPFLETDAEVAAQRRHLTARQAGGIAKRAGVSRLVPFHFSARYRDQEDRLRSEVERAFRAKPKR
jgi:ribonuclease Z